jgi:hypothetical protein
VPHFHWRTQRRLSFFAAGLLCGLALIAGVIEARADVPTYCSVSGTGAIADNTFAVEAAFQKKGTISGNGQNTNLPTGTKGQFQPEYLFCRHVDGSGPTLNQAYFGGHARLWVKGVGWSGGYWADVVVKDLGDAGSPSPDTYHFTIRRMVTGSVVLDVSGELLSGNVLLTPRAVGFSTPLPSWVALEP